ncbi:MAG TPA: YqgE/AlgH family protein [Vicinamibacterales bacterium]|nr:YqgE/AlgH family protein [Vicinamibacterales bacterium]
MPDREEVMTPMMLISMPQLADPNFSRTVVLLCEYGTDGAFGLIVNKPMAKPAHEMVQTEPAMDIREDVHLFTGGPVEPMRAWVLTSRPSLDEDATEVADGVFLSASPSAIRTALTTPPGQDVKVLVGYAGWSAGQLDAEMVQASWLLVPVGADLIFDSAPAEMWDKAIERLGADPAHLLGSPGVH